MLLCHEKEPKTVDAIAKRLNLVKSHVMKIVAKLVKAQLLVSQRGRAGGISLARKPQDITVGEVVRLVEADFAIVECMLDKPSECVFACRCKLRAVMGRAKAAFLAELDQETLKSIAAGTTAAPA